MHARRALNMTSGMRSLISRLPRLGLALVCLGLWLAGIGVGTAHATPAQIASVARPASGPSFTVRPAFLTSNVPTGALHFLFNVAQGVTTTETITVTNVGDKAGAVLLYAADGATSQTGGVTFQSATAPKTDIGAWLTLDSTQLTLNPGQQQNVTIHLTVPSDAAPGQHEGGIVAQNLTTQTSANQGGYVITVVHQYVMPVQVALPGATFERVDITGVTTGGANGYQTLLVGLRNSGTQIVSGNGTLVVSQQGSVLQNLSFSFKSFLPRTAIQYPLNVQNKALNSGSYSADVTVTYGNGQVAHQIVTFNVSDQDVSKVFPPGPLSAPTSALSPLLLIGGGVGVALLLLLFMLFIVRSRRASPAEDRPRRPAAKRERPSAPQDRRASQERPEFREWGSPPTQNEPGPGWWDRLGPGAEA